jgi:hypothetical protein
MHLRSRASRLEGVGKCLALSTAFLLFVIGPAIGQQPAPAQSAPQLKLPQSGIPAQPAAAPAPPSLEVDRDPVPSPDPDPPPQPIGNQPAAPLGTIARGTRFA